MRWARGMSGVCILFLVGTLIGISQADSSIFSGFLGCRFSSGICGLDEECVDDRLFGNCQKANNVKDFYQYYLNHEQLKILEGEITRLLGEGFTWDNLYTQCTLGNILLAFRAGYESDPNFCDVGSIAREQQISKELADDTLKLLEKYFVDYYDDLIVPKVSRQELMPAEESQRVDLSYPLQSSEFDSYEDNFDISGPFEKKDEFVKVHKYLKSHKRDPFDSGSLEDLKDEAELMYNYDVGSKLDNLSGPEIDLLKAYLGDNYDYPDLASDRDDKGDEDFSEDIPLTMDDNQEDIPLTMDDNQEVDQQVAPQSAAYTWEDSESPDLPAPNGMQLPAPIAESESEDELMPAFMAMTPKDAKVLGDLLQGNIRVSKLSDKEIERLTTYVDSMLKALNRMDTEELGEIEQYLEPEEDLDVPEVHMAVKKEQTNFDSLKSAISDSKVSVDVAPPEDVDLLKDPHDHHFDDDMKPVPTSRPKYDRVAANYAYLTVKPKTDDQEDAVLIVDALENLLELPLGTFSDVRVEKGDVNFKVEKNPHHLNGSAVAALALSLSNEILNRTGFAIKDSGFGNINEAKVSVFDVANDGPKYFVLTFVLCGVIAGLVLAVVAIYIVRRHNRSRDKLAQLATTSDPTEASKDYQDLCRQRMQSKTSEKPEPLHVAQRVGSVSATEQAARSPSSRSSTSSWSEEPVTSNMDISTGHIVLSYMEDHLKNRDRLNQEWDALCAYEAEPNGVTVAQDASNLRKNRYSDVVPYDHSRVVLNSATNVSGSDYINASTITDHDPRNPAYIASQGPLPHTVADFWQMVWEQGSVVLVDLTKLAENGQALCHRYWPEEGSDLYHIYEVHLVSEHIWCDDYLVRSFYLKNLQTNETRTVTQFHFLTWPDLGVPSSAKALLDFRRKVNKSYRGRSCPIVVHCSDGSGRTGTYCLIDLVLNRMSKGAKEIDIAASLEHIRDQRMQVVKTKEQFEFALAAVAEEVHAILKALPQ